MGKIVDFIQTVIDTLANDRDVRKYFTQAYLADETVKVNYQAYMLLLGPYSEEKVAVPNFDEPAPKLAFFLFVQNSDSSMLILEQARALEIFRNAFRSTRVEFKNELVQIEFETDTSEAIGNHMARIPGLLTLELQPNQEGEL